ncbi:DUF6638 family protein [Rubellicoccus peritrichatus]|uniref:DUF6638 family protein n=1 Tax=Rubellicoccus peritrichatus TaxID=3080537 RepID=A0AAQ3LA91_9BACT|nr:DUF6638 family protein [Puniceicoccus sp. CR14]WOO41696.1 DUF6638 family protein [Puniceicoccus sp. CR14]
MEILQQKGFFGHSLVPVTTPLLVERYNECLRALDKEETLLERFSIDGAGWSPQIAKEKNDPNYLCHGEANLYAVLLTPNQMGKPVYVPMHSFDAAILQTVHNNNSRAINNLTSRTGIILDIDQGIDAYECPLDLLMLDTFTIRAFTPTAIMQGARDQKELVARFRKEPGAWQDATLIDSLIQSAKDLGDLRHSALQIAPTPFNDVGNFYTRAMGGLYVLRDAPDSQCKIVIMAGADHEVDSLPKRDVYSIPKDWEPLIERLTALDFLQPYGADPSEATVARLEQTLHMIIAQEAYANGLEEDFDGLNPAKLASWKQRLRGELKPAYGELSQLAKAIRRGEKHNDDLEFDAWTHVLQPNPQLPESTRSILWHLLSRIQPHNIEMTYRHHKSLFYERYQSWSKPQRIWALNFLTNQGLPHHE